MEILLLLILVLMFCLFVACVIHDILEKEIVYSFMKTMMPNIVEIAEYKPRYILKFLWRNNVKKID